MDLQWIFRNEDHEGRSHVITLLRLSGVTIATSLSGSTPFSEVIIPYVSL